MLQAIIIHQCRLKATLSGAIACELTFLDLQGTVTCSCSWKEAVKIAERVSVAKSPP